VNRFIYHVVSPACVDRFTFRDLRVIEVVYLILWASSLHIVVAHAA